MAWKLKVKSYYLLTIFWVGINVKGLPGPAMSERPDTPLKRFYVPKMFCLVKK